VVERLIEINPLMVDQLKTILTTVAGSIIYSFLSYIKRPDISEQWDNHKFFTTMAIAVVAGFIAGWFNISPQQATDYLVQSGYMAFVVMVVENIWKYLTRRVFPQPEPTKEIS
jgi:energy-converting hydrogenase Eha subunit A